MKTYTQCGSCAWDRPDDHVGRCPKCGGYAFEPYTLEHLKPKSADKWEQPSDEGFKVKFVSWDDVFMEE